MSDIIKPDFEKHPDIDKAFYAFLFTNIKDIVDKCGDDNSFQKLSPLVDKMDAFRKQLFIVNRFDHVDPLLSTVKRLQEEKEELLWLLKTMAICTNYYESNALRGDTPTHWTNLVDKALKSSDLNK